MATNISTTLKEGKTTPSWQCETAQGLCKKTKQMLAGKT